MFILGFALRDTGDLVKIFTRIGGIVASETPGEFLWVVGLAWGWGEAGPSVKP